MHYEGRGELVQKHVQEADRVYLARDRTDHYSPHAVEVRLNNGMQIGFVPEEFAEVIAPLLDQGYPHRAFVKKIVGGGRVPISVVIGEMYPRETDRPNVEFEVGVPPKVL